MSLSQGQRVLVLFTTARGDRHDGQVQASRRSHLMVHWVNTRVQLVKLDVMTEVRNIEPTTIVLRNQQSQAHILVDRTERGTVRLLTQ